MRIAEIADLGHRMNPSGHVDEFTCADVHSRVGDMIRSATEKKQISGLQICPVHSDRAVPGSLQIGIAWDQHTAPAAKHLSETGTVVAEAGCAAPGVRQAEETPAESDDRLHRQRLGIEGNIAALQPAGAIVRQTDFEPARRRASAGSATTSRRVSKGTVSRGW